MNLGINNYAVSIFLALQSKHIYLGTVSNTIKARRRAKNKMAKLSRRKNR